MSKRKIKSVRRRLVTIPRLVILCLLVLVMTMGVWIYVRNTIVNNLIASITNWENQNYQIAHNGLSIDGFPFLVNAKMGEVIVRAPISDVPDPTKNWSVTTDRIRMYSATLTPLSWNFEHRGLVRIDMRGYNGERYTFDITPTNIDGHIAYSMVGTLKSAHIDVDHAQLDALVGSPPIISKFERIGADIKVSDNTGRVSVSGADIRLSPKIPDIFDDILGRKLALVELNANIENWALLETEGDRAWIADNSTLKSDYWAVRWGHVDVVGSFDITFKNGLPEGIIYLHLKNSNQLLQKLIYNKHIPSEYSGMAKTLIALQKNNTDGRKSIEITIKDGVVKTGFIPIYKFQTRRPLKNR